MSKYTYEQSWAKLKEECPKINFKSYVNTSSALTIQTWIANELAETNRLKRIELTLSNSHFDQHEGIYCTIKKELEDEA